jgi:hypothetical protein
MKSRLSRLGSLLFLTLFSPFVKAQLSDDDAAAKKELLAPDPTLQRAAESLFKWLGSADFKRTACPSFFSQKGISLPELRQLLSRIDFYFVGSVSGRSSGTVKPFGLASMADVASNGFPVLMGLMCVDGPKNQRGNTVRIDADTTPMVSSLASSPGRFMIRVCPTLFDSSESMAERRASFLHELFHVYLDLHPYLYPDNLSGDPALRYFLTGNSKIADPSLDGRNSQGIVVRPYTHDITDFFLNGCVVQSFQGVRASLRF